MTGWTPHKTRQQTTRARSPLARKVDKGNPAPSKSVPPVVCSDCGHPRLAHFNEGPCWRCSCAEYVEAGDG